MKKEKKKLKLKQIRKQRKELEKETNKLQKRKVEIIEYEDGTFNLGGYAYDLPLEKNEVEDAFKSWLDGSLESGIKIK